jgi:hypothetical protein
MVFTMVRLMFLQTILVKMGFRHFWENNKNWNAFNTHDTLFLGTFAIRLVSAAYLVGRHIFGHRCLHGIKIGREPGESYVES